MKHKKLSSLIFILLAIATNSLGLNIKQGDSVTNITAELGEPSGIATMNGLTYYMYDGGNIIAKDSTIVSVPEDFELASQRKQQKRLELQEFEASQKAKGLVLYEGKWITPAQKNQLEVRAAEQEEKLLLLSWSWRTEYGYAIAEGEVKNISTRPLENVEAVAIFYTTDHKFITSDDSLIKFNPILPGQTSPFKVMATYNPEMKTASIIFKNLTGGTIPFKSNK